MQMPNKASKQHQNWKRKVKQSRFMQPDVQPDSLSIMHESQLRRLLLGSWTMGLQ